MNHCPCSTACLRLVRRGLLLLALLLPGLPAAVAEQSPPPNAENADNFDQPATLPRSFPDKAEKGYILFLEPPMAMIDGVRMRVSPGSRIKDQHNRMLTAAQLQGKEFHIMYTRDATLQIGDVWLLSDYEARHTIPPKQKRDLQLRYMGVDPTHKVDPLVPYNRQPKFQN